jgi:small subunit ribosomal protein S1
MKNKKDLFGDDTVSTPAEAEAPANFDFARMLEASLSGKSLDLKKGDRVEAEVLTLGRDDIFVSVHGQDGVIPRSELSDEKGNVTVKVGDKVILFVIKKKESLYSLTAKVSSKALAESIEDAFDFETPVDGRVTEAVNGGFRVEVMHKIAFCPMSQMDSKPIQNPEDYIGKKFTFIISEFGEKGRKFVVSRRKLLDIERAEDEGKFMDQVEVGAQLTGQVTRLEAFGAFVKLNLGVEGLVHISELGWSRVNHPSEVVKVGDAVTVKVLKIDEDDRGRLKVSLSCKQAGEDPWVKDSQGLQVGQTFEGKIKEQAHFGWLIEIRPGLVGLLPKSLLRESMDEKAVSEKKPGHTVRVVINSVQPAERRISLSLPRSQDEGDWADLKITPGKSMGTLGDQFANLFDAKNTKTKK